MFIVALNPALGIMTLGIVVWLLFAGARKDFQARDAFQRDRARVCLSCGYDCADLPITEHPMCPECGTVRGAYIEDSLLGERRRAGPPEAER